MLCRCHRDDIKSVTKKTTIGDFCFFFKLFFFLFLQRMLLPGPSFSVNVLPNFLRVFWRQNWQKKIQKKIPTVTGSSCSIYLTERKQKNYYCVQCTIDERRCTCTGGAEGANPWHVNLWIFSLFYFAVCECYIRCYIYVVCRWEATRVRGSFFWLCGSVTSNISVGSFPFLLLLWT